MYIQELKVHSCRCDSCQNKNCRVLRPVGEVSCRWFILSRLYQSGGFQSASCWQAPVSWQKFISVRSRRGKSETGGHPLPEAVNFIDVVDVSSFRHLADSALRHSASPPDCRRRPPRHGPRPPSGYWWSKTQAAVPLIASSPGERFANVEGERGRVWGGFRVEISSRDTESTRQSRSTT